MDTNKQTRKEEKCDEESCSCSNENRKEGKGMFCPYMNACPLMFQMTQYSQANINSNEDEEELTDETEIRSPRPGGHHDGHNHGGGHHYGGYGYNYYPYYPYYPYPNYGNYYPQYPYYNRPWWMY